MLIRQIKVKDYTTGKQVFKEVTPKQHTDLLRKVALTGSTLEIEMIKERDL